MANASLDPSGMLAEHRVLQCSNLADFDEFIAAWGARKEGLVDPDVMRRSGPTDIEIRTTSLGHVDVVLMRCSVNVAAEASRGRSAAYLLQFALSAEVDYEIDGRSLRLAPCEGVVLSPASSVRRSRGSPESSSRTSTK